MMKGRNNGKKLMAVRIVAHAFEIIHLLTDQNPIQVWLPHQGPLALTYIYVGPG
jgi:ribosomal protein S7